MKNILILCFTALLFHSALSEETPQIQIKTPKVMLSGVAFDLELSLPDRKDNYSGVDTSVWIVGLQIMQKDQVEALKQVRFIEGKTRIQKLYFSEGGVFEIKIPEYNFTTTLRIIPGWLSLLPPLIAILLALLLRQVLVALFVGIWTGTTIIYDYSLIKGFFFSLTEYIGKAPADPDKMSIIIFSLTLGGMVGVISKMGGTQGIVEKLSK
jgi:hypothetical protein